MPPLHWYGPTWINRDIQNYLADIQENQEIISWKYIDNTLNPNFKEMVKHLFPWDEDRFKILNPWSYIWGLVDDKISSYFWIPKDELWYRIDYDKIIETLLTTWYLMLKVWSNEKTWWGVEAIEWHKYFDDGVTEIFVEQYKIEEKNPLDNNIMSSKHYVYVQTFSNNVLKNELFEIQSWVLSFWKSVGLDLIPELTWRPEEQIVTETDRLVYKVKLESSLINKSKSIIYSIERKWAEADKQFQNYMEQFKVFNNIEIPINATKKVFQNWIEYTVTDFSKLWSVVEVDADIWEGTIEIIKNWNDLIKEALEFSERQIRQISAITDLPPIFLGLSDSQWNDSWTSIIKSSWPLYKRIQRYRDWLENLFNDITEVLSTIKPEFTWDSIVTSDPADIIKNERQKLADGLTTKIMSIMKIHDVDEVKAKEIYEARIEEIKIENELWIEVWETVKNIS